MEVVDSLYPGYGEAAAGGRGPMQDSIRSRGNEYLRQGFARLDFMRRANIVRE